VDVKNVNMMKQLESAQYVSKQIKSLKQLTLEASFRRNQLGDDSQNKNQQMYTNRSTSERETGNKAKKSK
jgi:hypothetical protein